MTPDARDRMLVITGGGLGAVQQLRLRLGR
jgi:hypothetical protein